MIRVACIGDSITEVTGYPEDLQTLLGNQYLVEKFGVVGATILINTDRPFLNQTAFKDAQKFQPNIVIILLGTNDARTNIYETSQSLEADLRALTKSVENFGSRPKIFFATPPPLFSNNLSLSIDNLEGGVIPRVKAVVSELQLPVIDVYGALSGHSEYFPDGVHPNNEGAKAIANVVFEAIKR